MNSYQANRARRFLTLAATSAWIGCGVDRPDVTGVSTPDWIVDAPVPAPPGVALADPISVGSVPQLAMAPSLSGDLHVGDDVAYLSLPSGSFPDATDLAVSNPVLGSQVVLPLVAGGLDPVAVPASVGDELEFELLRGLTEIVTWKESVPLTSPPIVVRSHPSGGRRDVPVALRPMIVFSEPMRPSTLDPENILLLRNGSPVDGSATFTDGTRLSVAFVPSVPLVEETAYVLVVTNGVRDLDGEALAFEQMIPFTTSRGDGGPTYTLRGMVTDSSSTGVRPSSGAYVNAWVQTNHGFAYSYWWARGPTFADSTGAYVLSGLPAGATVRVIVSRAGYYLQCAPPTATMTGDALRIDARLVGADVISATAPPSAPGYRSVSGVIRLASGSPAAAVEVYFDHLDEMDEVGAQAVSDPGGRYLLCGLPADKAVTIVAVGPGGRFTRIRVPPGGDVTNADLLF